MMVMKTLIGAATLAFALVASPVSARLFNFNVKLDSGSPLPGLQFVQTFNSSLHQGVGSYNQFPDRIEERRSVFGSATAYDNPLLVALQAETGTTGFVFFDKFEADQLIFDNFVNPKSYSFSLSFSDQRIAANQLSATLYEIGDLTITITGNSSTDDPNSPLAGFYLDTDNGLNTVLRNTRLRFSAVGAVYTYDEALGQIVDVKSVSHYFGDASLVPEPAQWLLMIGGFGLVGATQRRRRAIAA